MSRRSVPQCAGCFDPMPRGGRRVGSLGRLCYQCVQVSDEVESIMTIEVQIATAQVNAFNERLAAELDP